MAGKPYLDGVGVNVFGDWVKNKIEQSLGEGSLDLAVPQVKIEYPDSGDHAVVTLETNYDLVSSGVVVVGYTTDGTTPEVTSTEFHSPMDLYKNGTLTLRAFLALTAEQMIPSVANAVNISGLKCQRPTYTYNDDTYQFTLACATPEANIRYTTNGSEPTDSSALYSGPVTVSESCTVKAKAFLDGIDASETLSFEASVAKVFGVEWNYGQSSPALTRLQPTTDPLHLVTELISSEPSPATSASSGGSSPFDAYNPWAGMRRRNFLADGTPGPWEDEPGFSTTSYDTMVWIPKFWIKVVDDSSAKLRKYYIADNNAEGFTLHPGSGQYIGAYPTSNSKESKGGKSRTGSQSIVTMRSNAKTKGAGWGLIDIAQRSAIQFLYLIEFANWDTQSMIGDGPTSDYSTGYTDSMTYHTGKGTNNVIKYRHIEGLWRSQYEWTDGFNTVAGHHYVSTDRDNYQSDVTTGYTEVGSGKFTGYPIKELLYNESVPWLIGMPKPNGDTGGSYTTYVCDYGYLFGSATFVPDCGGYWGDSAYAGLFSFRALNSSSYTDSGWGSRLSYKEPSAD